MTQLYRNYGGGGNKTKPGSVRDRDQTITCRPWKSAATWDGVTYGDGPGAAPRHVEYSACPKCGAGPGELCIGANGGPTWVSHYFRPKKQGRPWPSVAGKPDAPILLTPNVVESPVTRVVIKLTPTAYLLDIDDRGEPVETSVEAQAWRFSTEFGVNDALDRIGGRARWQDAEILGVRL